MAKSTQRFLTLDGQIDLLTAQGLSIPDPAHAKEVLSDIGYYELVNGYKALYKCENSSVYRAGTTFDDLLALYKFDENLRQMCFKYILRIEIRMRSLLSYAFCEKHGIRQSAYLDAENYTDAPDASRRVKRIIGELRSATADARAPYVVHQREQYGNIPLWVLFKSLSLGTVVRFYDAASEDIRRETASAFGDIYPDTLGRMLGVMLDFRNACAHNNILYTCKSDDSIPPLPFLRRVLGTGKWDYDGNDLFALFVIFRCLLKPEDFAKCERAFHAICDHYLLGVQCVGREELFRVMGFPERFVSMQ